VPNSLHSEEVRATGKVRRVKGSERPLDAARARRSMLQRGDLHLWLHPLPSVRSEKETFGVLGCPSKA
jgi:hypothetical protein